MQKNSKNNKNNRNDRNKGFATVKAPNKTKRKDFKAESEVIIPNPPHYTELAQENFNVYLAPRYFEKELAHDLGESIIYQHERIFLAHNTQIPTQNIPWAQNIWYNPQWIPINSISHAAKSLKAIQRNWTLYPTLHHRRAALITEQLPSINIKPHVFGNPVPTSPLGAWTLWDENTLLVAKKTASPFAHGQVNFVENKIDPPGRAYLKLWEVFTLLNIYPKKGELCLDLGSSPGGWTWVLGNLGASVFSIDKAPLAENVEKIPNVSHCLGSGFALEPEYMGKVDWFFSDMICYPQRLLELVQRWLEKGQCKNFICTLKFQAETDYATAAAFASIEGSRLMHLSCNKHELTWVLIR